MPDEDTQDESLEPQATSGGYNYPASFTRYEVFTPYTKYPYRCVGKLFFRRNGRNYVCSASSVGNNAIWSAGRSSALSSTFRRMDAGRYGEC